MNDRPSQSWSPADGTAYSAPSAGAAERLSIDPNSVSPKNPGPPADAGERSSSSPTPLAQALTATIACAVTVYLALSGGGYDIVLRSEVGVALWWLVLLGAIVGILPRGRLGRTAWLALGLFTAFLLWSWIGLSWSPSHEITRQEVCRLTTYLGVLVFVLCAVVGRTERSLLAGLAAGIAATSSLAVLSKLIPSLFPANIGAKYYLASRLSYPFDYADGVGEFAALGVPLLLYFATAGRSLAARVLAAAAAPVTLLCLAMTVSRGGILALIVGTIVFFALIPDRISRVPIATLVTVAAGVLLAAVVARPALRDSAVVAPASERHSMLAIIIATALLSAAIAAAIERYARRWQRPHWTLLSHSAARRGGLGLVAFVVLALVVAVVSGATGKAWHDFKQANPVAHSDQYLRLFSLAGSHRYQYWQVALHAFSSSPLHGLGPGGFRFYWAQHQPFNEYVINAHSLWIETLAETGLLGALLLFGFFAVLLVSGGRYALRRSADPHQRAIDAGVTATVAAFCAAAAFDWVWQIGVVPMVMLAAAATLLGRRGERGSGAVAASGPRAADIRRRNLLLRGGFAVAALVALWLILVPLATTVEVRASQSAAKSGDVAKAIKAANTAHQIQPGAASPLLQRALLLEQQGDLGAANTAIRQAIAREPKNAELWLIASRIATELDQPRVALADYRHARLLDPNFSSF